MNRFFVLSYSLRERGEFFTMATAKCEVKRETEKIRIIARRAVASDQHEHQTFQWIIEEKKLKRLTLKKRDREHFKIRNFISSLLRLAKRVKRPRKSNSWNPIVELELKIRAESARAALRCAAIDVHIFFYWSANCVRNIKSTRISIDLHYSGDVIAVQSMNTTQTCSLDSIKIIKK